MKVKIIKPNHTAEEIKKLYEGSDPKKKAGVENPKYFKFVLFKKVLMSIGLFFWLFLIKIGYIERLRSLQWQFDEFAYKTAIGLFSKIFVKGHLFIIAWILFIIVWIVVILLIWYFGFVYPYKCILEMINILINYKRKKLIEAGEIYKSPISYLDYISILQLYKEMEKVMPCLEQSNIAYIYIENDDTVEIGMWSPESVILKKQKYVFKGCAKDIFKSFESKGNNTIDFSVIDEKINNICKKGERL